eukprot:gene18016-59519_t
MVGPYGSWQCDSLPYVDDASGFHTVDCSLNTGAAPAAQSCPACSTSTPPCCEVGWKGCCVVPGPENGTRLGSDRSLRWTVDQPLTVANFHQDASSSATGFTSTTYGGEGKGDPILFTYACPNTVVVEKKAPKEIVVDNTFSVSLHTEDQWGNVGGNFTYGIRAFSDCGLTEEIVDTAFSGISIGADFLHMLKKLHNGANQGFVWLKVWAKSCDGKTCWGCDAKEKRCDPFLGAENSTYGNLHQTFGPILVTPDVAVSCEVTHGPQQSPPADEQIAGSRFGFSVRARILDKHGLPAHKLPKTKYADMACKGACTPGDDGALEVDAWIKYTTDITAGSSSR